MTTVRDKVLALNILKRCMGCGVALKHDDIVYVEDTDLFGVHGHCMTKVPNAPMNRVFSFIPLSMALDEKDFMTRMQEKYAK